MEPLLNKNTGVRLVNAAGVGGGGNNQYRSLTGVTKDDQSINNKTVETYSSESAGEEYVENEPSSSMVSI